MLKEEIKIKKVWDVLSLNLKTEKLSRNKIKLNITKSQKFNKKINRKIIPLFIDDENKVYERDEIIHKFDVFENERKKKYTDQKMNNLFNSLFYNKPCLHKREKEKYEKNNYDVNHNFFKSPSAKKYFLTYRNNDNNNNIDFPQINSSGSDNNYYKYNKNLKEKNNFSKEENFEDSIETNEKIIKNLDEKYSFFNKNKKNDQRQIKIYKIFKNPKIKKIEYCHNIDKVKRCHFMDLTPENILSRNNTHDKLFNNNNKIMYNTMGKLNFQNNNNSNLKKINKIFMNSTTGLSFLKRKNIKKNKSPEIEYYVKKIINCFNKK